MRFCNCSTALVIELPILSLLSILCPSTCNHLEQQRVFINCLRDICCSLVIYQMRSMYIFPKDTWNVWIYENKEEVMLNVFLGVYLFHNTFSYRVIVLSIKLCLSKQQVEQCVQVCLCRRQPSCATTSTSVNPS